jgi:hypothetical protein
MKIEDFYNLHKGETCLIAGVGENLKLTPPELFDLPSFGVNTIYRYEGWKPTYYVGVDERLRLEDGAAVIEKYSDIPKFFPTPDWDGMKGDNIYRFLHRTGGDLTVGGHLANQKDALTKFGLNYRRIMDAVFQIAWHMGFTTMLMIGIHHKPNTRRAHFWGQDETQVGHDFIFEESGYIHFHRAMQVKILNISADTYLSEKVLPRDDWRKFVKSQKLETALPHGAQNAFANVLAE